MTLESFVLFVLIGALAGFIAAKITRGFGLGLLWNIVIGVAGAFLGAFLFGLFGLHFGGIVGTLFTATIGAVLLLAALTGLMRRRLYV